MARPLAVTARLAATALLRGPFDAVHLARTLTQLRGRRTKALHALADRLVATFGAGARPRERALALFLCTQPTFVAAFGRLGLRLDVTARPRMQPVAGPPSTWQLPKLTTLGALARWLALEPDQLQALRAPRAQDRRSTPRHAHYHIHWIPRRHGPPRLLEAPKARLKAVQQRIARDLLAHVPTHDAAHGFVRGRSPRTFVAPHAARACVLRMDVQDFFASYGRARVRRIFVTAGYPEPVAAALADVCTTRTPRAVCELGLGAAIGEPATEALRARLLHRHLPQGAPSSPVLANLCAFALDARLAGLARRFGADYTRYADDLLFSGGPEFARDAARCEVRVAAILLECGLAAAHRKTKVMRAATSQRAAGLVCNARPAIPRRERELVEAIVVNCARRGAAQQNRAGHPDFAAHLRGRIARIAELHPALGARLLGLFAQIAW